MILIFMAVSFDEDGVWSSRANGTHWPPSDRAWKASCLAGSPRWRGAGTPCATPWLRSSCGCGRARGGVVSSRTQILRPLCVLPSSRWDTCSGFPPPSTRERHVVERLGEFENRGAPWRKEGARRSMPHDSKIARSPSWVLEGRGARHAPGAGALPRGGRRCSPVSATRRYRGARLGGAARVVGRILRLARLHGETLARASPRADPAGGGARDLRGARLRGRGAARIRADPPRHQGGKT